MWFLPTHKRPEKLKRFLGTVAGPDRDESVMLILWKNDPRLHDYADAFRHMPSNWDVWVQEERLCGPKLQNAFKCFPEERTYGFLADDTGLGSVGMLGELRREAEQGVLAWPNDGIHGPRMATHPCASGEFLRKLGFWAHPNFPHNGFDTILYYIAESIGVGKYRVDLNLIHWHPFKEVTPGNGWNHAEWDETYDEAREMNTKAIDAMYDFQERVLPGLVDRMRREYRGQEIQS